MDEGPCQKVHSEVLKADFQKSRDVHAYDALIEREFNNRIMEADRVIKVILLDCCSLPKLHTTHTFVVNPR